MEETDKTPLLPPLDFDCVPVFLLLFYVQQNDNIMGCADAGSPECRLWSSLIPV